MKRGEFIWNGWTRNYMRSEDGYITHAFDEQECRERGAFRAVCGVKLEDSGFVALGENRWFPGCIRCKRILEQRGLIKITRDKTNPRIITEVEFLKLGKESH